MFSSALNSIWHIRSKQVYWSRSEQQFIPWRHWQKQWSHLEHFVQNSTYSCEVKQRQQYRRIIRIKWKPNSENLWQVYRVKGQPTCTQPVAAVMAWQRNSSGREMQLREKQFFTFHFHLLFIMTTWYRYFSHTHTHTHTHHYTNDKTLL